MRSSEPHTVRAFDDDLEQIRALVAELGGLVEDALSGAVRSLVEADDRAAGRIIVADARIDALALEIEHHCIRMIALRAPMADDLRTILAAFKISVLLERMGDCARNIAEQACRIGDPGWQRQLRVLQAMLASVSGMVRDALDAFVREDPGACRHICESDAAVDGLRDQLFHDLLDEMSAQPTRIAPLASLLLASLKLERIGDHAANIARVVHRLETGVDEAPAPAGAAVP